MGVNGNGDGIALDFWALDAESYGYSVNPAFTWNEYGLTEKEKEINIFDYLPSSEISNDIKLEELSGCSQVPLQEAPVEPVKCEQEEPCAAAIAIAANIPKPKKTKLLKWRTFINAAYYHPNILAHEDVSCIKELLQLLGSNKNFENNDVMIDLGQTIQDYKPVPYLRPSLPSSQTPLIFSFAHVKDFKIDAELKVCIVKSYGLDDSMKRAVQDLSSFIVTYPEALYLEIYGFILDFLLRYRVNPDVVIDTVMKTQARRRKCQQPASTLLLKMANKLGKGRKEFLQKKMMETPSQKYDPVVHIIEDAPPVRQLRSRRGAPDLERSPVLTPQLPGITEPNRLSSSGDNLVYAVKRKLFFDDEPKPPVLQRVTVARAAPIGKKRRYSRRDSDSIEKPFACTICPSRAFAYKGNLVLHMKKHTLAKLISGNRRRQENQVPAFTCPVCMHGYASKYKCKAHMERFHPEISNPLPVSNHQVKLNAKKTVLKAKKRLGKARRRPTVKTRRKVHPLLDRYQNNARINPTVRLTQLNLNSCSRPQSLVYRHSENPHHIRLRSRVRIFHESLYADPIKSLRTKQRAVV